MEHSMKRLVLLLCLLSSPALAVDLSIVLKSPGGLPMKDNFAEDLAGCTRPSPESLSCKPDLTVGKVVFNSLIFLNPDDKATPQQKFKRGELARHVYNASEVTLTAEEITMIKDGVGKIYSPLIVYDVFKVLDPASK